MSVASRDAGPNRQKIQAGDVRAVLMDKGSEPGDTLNTTDTGSALKHNGSRAFLGLSCRIPP